MNNTPKMSDEKRLKNAYRLLSDMEQRMIELEKDNKRSANEPIAIVGMSCRFPGGCNSPDQYWDLLKSGKNVISEVPKGRWDMGRYFDPDKNVPNKSYSKWGGFIDDISSFDPLFFNISPKEAEVMDPQHRLFLEECWHAFEDAGYSSNTLSEMNCGVYVGVYTQEYSELLNADPH
ncbi:MAG: polyketide synthase, partial [Candidatus Margulisbacteria bacterium]|nr:polyketide synthase [Candidatus Margulisiibacteriota bacterium]